MKTMKRDKGTNEEAESVPAAGMIAGFCKRFAYIVRLVWNAGPWILLLLTFMALYRGVTPVISSLISKSILNELQGVVKNGPYERAEMFRSPVYYLLIFLFVHRAMIRVVNNLNTALRRIAGEKVVMQVRRQMMEKSKELDLASFDDPAFYEKMENANREAGSRPLTILTDTFGVVSTVIEFVSYLVILLAAPGLWWATLMVIAVSIPSAVINFLYRRKNYRYVKWNSKGRRKMSYFSGLLVNKDKMKEVRMYDLADTFIGRYVEAFNDYYAGLRRLIFSESAWHIALGFVTCGTNLIFFLLIVSQVFTGEIRIGDYTLYTGAVTSVANCISTLISNSASVYEGTLFIDNLIAFMKEKRTIVPRPAQPLAAQKNTRHRIEFDHVSFRYPGTARDVLRDVSFVLSPGETVMLVGLNGAGKTTLIKLLTRLYDPTEGRILLDGRDLRDYDVQSLYSLFGIIFQDFGRYAMNVEENIRFGDIGREPEAGEVEAAAGQSSAKAFIDNLPDGYETPLMRIFEPNGVELSGGQWQKLAISRAFYADADILILDEPTASLDPLAEQAIFSQFDLLRAEKTTIFVSHRLSSASVADRIIVLDGGTLAENGTHDELMELGGKYYELFTAQAKRYLREETRGGLRSRKNLTETERTENE